MTIQRDKKMHFVVGLIIGTVVGVASGVPIFGVTAAAVAGVAKELYDWISGKGRVEGADALVTTMGGALGTVISILWVLR